MTHKKSLWDALEPIAPVHWLRNLAWSSLVGIVALDAFIVVALRGCS